MHPDRAKAYRFQVAALLEAVLEGWITPRIAIHCWPMLGNEDPSIQCVYSMLWFFESDEDRHFQEVFYSDVQLQTLRDVWMVLKQGEPLSLAILTEYGALHAPPEYGGHWVWRKPLWSLNQMLKTMRQIFEVNPWLRQLENRLNAKRR